MEKKSCGNGYILIDTYTKSYIKGWVLLEMEGISCDLYVKETIRDSCCDFISVVHLKVGQSVPCNKAAHGAFSCPHDDKGVGISNGLGWLI